MANNFIPKIEFNKQTQTGIISIGSDIITSVATTALIKVGMLVKNSNFPSGATVLSKTVATVTVSGNATANAAESIDFLELVELTLPPKGDPFGEEIRHVGTTSTAKSGISYSFTDYIQKNNKVTLSHFDQATKEKLETFFVTWAFLGNSFYYFDDKDDELTSRFVELNPSAKRAKFKVISRSGTGRNFKWTVNISMRELL